MLEKVADSARKAVKLAEPYKPYGGQFLEFCSISLLTYQTCMKLTRKSTEFCQIVCRHYPHTCMPAPEPRPIEETKPGWTSVQEVSGLDSRMHFFQFFSCQGDSPISIRVVEGATS